MKTSAYMIGGTTWPGLSKLVEEAGEVIQIAGKLMGSAGSTEHWSGDLTTGLHHEIADLYAALDFFVGMNALDREEVAVRRESKLALFVRWHRDTLASKENS